MISIKALLFLLTLSVILVHGQQYDKLRVKQNKVSSIKEYMYRPYGKKTTKKLMHAFYFDQKGNLIEEYNALDFAPVIKYKYDSLSQLIEKIYYSPKNKIKEYHTWTYDNAGNIKTDFSHYSFGDYSDSFIYDNYYKLIEQYRTNSNRELAIYTYQYHPNGNLYEVISKNGKNRSVGYVSKYDTCGNLILKVENGDTQEYIIDYLHSCHIDTPSLYIKSRVIDTLADKSIKITTLHPHRKTIEIISPNGSRMSIEGYAYFISEKGMSSSHTSIYNHLGQVIESKDFYSGKEAWQCSQAQGPLPDSYYHFKYLYYDNGLIKRYNAYDTKGKLREYMDYIVEYHQ